MSESKTRGCYNCGSHITLKQCGRCRGVTYCSNICQISSWPDHKLGCLAQTSTPYTNIPKSWKPHGLFSTNNFSYWMVRLSKILPPENFPRGVIDTVAGYLIDMLWSGPISCNGISNLCGWYGQYTEGFSYGNIHEKTRYSVVFNDQYVSVFTNYQHNPLPNNQYEKIGHISNRSEWMAHPFESGPTIFLLTCVDAGLTIDPYSNKDFNTYYSSLYIDVDNRNRYSYDKLLTSIQKLHNSVGQKHIPELVSKLIMSSSNNYEWLLVVIYARITCYRFDYRDTRYIKSEINKAIDICKLDICKL